jgi:hypothetical protein
LECEFQPEWHLTVVAGPSVVTGGQGELRGYDERLSRRPNRVLPLVRPPEPHVDDDGGGDQACERPEDSFKQREI